MQRVPTLAVVLNLVYPTGMHVNIDLKNGTQIAKSVVMLVLKCCLQGKVIYALSRPGMAGINAILKIDPDARFIDYEADFARTVKGFTQCGKRSLCYTWDSC